MSDTSGPGEHRRTTLTTGGGRGHNGEVEVRYRVAGPPDAPPLVLCHGIGLDAAAVSWRHALPVLAADRRVYAPDFPGHGDSEKPTTRYTTAFFRDVLEAFLEDRGLRGGPLDLMGVSMGGGVALGHALDADDVDRLVLVDSYGLGADAPWRPAAATMLRVPLAHQGWWRTIGSSPAMVREHLRPMTGGAPPEDLVTDVYEVVQEAAVGRTVASWQRSEFRAGGLATDYSDRLDELDCETLLVHGKRDPLLPASWSVDAAERTGADLAVFGDCGHWVPREAPGKFNHVVGEFLR